MKKVWIAIAAVVVIVAGYFIYQNNQPAPEMAQTEQPAAPAQPPKTGGDKDLLH